MSGNTATKFINSEESNFFAKLVVFAIALPLILMTYGIISRYDNFDVTRSIQAQEMQLQNVKDRLEQSKNSKGKYSNSIKTEIDGKQFAGDKAMAKVSSHLIELKFAEIFQFARGVVPPITAIAGGVSALIALLLLAGGNLIGLSGRLKLRNELFLNNFWLLKLILPPAFMVQIVGLGIAVIGAFVIFGTGFIAMNPWVNIYIQTAIIIPLVFVFAIWMWRSMLRQLKSIKNLFVIETQTVIGQLVLRDEAPSLWAKIDEFAQKLNTTKPENIIIGVDGSFFAMSGKISMEPLGEIVTGHSLYIPLTQSALLNEDEFWAIIAHEMAHFSGDDLEYSRDYVPLYNSLNHRFNSLAQKKNSLFFLLKPCAWLGIYLLEQFDEAAENFKQSREFIADKNAAKLTSTLSLARGILRLSANIDPIETALSQVNLLNKNLPPNMVLAAANIAKQDKVQNPQAYLSAVQTHRFYLHPTNGERLDNLRVAVLNLDTDIVPFGEKYFPQYSILCQRLSTAFYNFVQRDAAGYQKHLIKQAQIVGDTQKRFYNYSKLRGIILLLFGATCLGAIYPILKFMRGHNEKTMIMGAEIAGGVLILLGVYYLLMAIKPFMVVEPDFIFIKGLNNKINWGDIDDFKISKGYGINTRFYLNEAAQLPSKKYNGRIRIDAKKHMISVFSNVPKGLNTQKFTAILKRYHKAYLARKTLEKYDLKISEN
ncbi:M48 family metallopeptidase [Pseudaquidulcibacter saccharophilus]|uniref:M48 family metallopeptidase n=1 Tax=Pseudaquidulcibacter saccharophilus TaxID=2831900 RepID=UPI001EFEF871|nr:M48 family metallopeptidase [Pseudaquidulcibacter saccharophilus]